MANKLGRYLYAEIEHLRASVVRETPVHLGRFLWEESHHPLKLRLENGVEIVLWTFLHRRLRKRREIKQGKRQIT